MLTVLLTDGEFTGMIRSLREIPEIRIVGICFSENAAHTAMLDSSYVAPAWDSPEYLPFLLDIIKKEHVDIVFPVVTNSLPYMASVAGEIHEKTGALVVTSPFTAISKANDKAALFSALKSNLETSEYITEYKNRFLGIRAMQRCTLFSGEKCTLHHKAGYRREQGRLSGHHFRQRMDRPLSRRRSLRYKLPGSAGSS